MDYQGNANKNKEAKNTPETPKKDIQKVVSGEVVVKPKTVGSRFKSIFFGGDASSAMHYVFSEVLIPALKRLAVESVSQGADRLVYGNNSAPRRRGGASPYSTRIQYNNPVVRMDPRQSTYLPDQNPASRWLRESKNAGDVIVGSKDDADAVVTQLIEIVDMYEMVSMADLNECLGLASTPIENKWGWRNLARIEVAQVKDGWKISLPPMEEL
jgi:hypothetical protein